jgi:hypothetical protein
MYEAMNKQVIKSLSIRLSILLCFLSINFVAYTATKVTVAGSDGVWGTAANWNTAGAPAAGDNVTVNKALTLNVNLSINAGTYIFNSPVTDLAGVPLYGLTIASGLFSPGTLTVNANTFLEGTGNINGNGTANAVLTVESGATLTLGATTFGKVLGRLNGPGSHQAVG